MQIKVFRHNNCFGSPQRGQFKTSESIMSITVKKNNNDIKFYFQKTHDSDVDTNRGKRRALKSDWLFSWGSHEATPAWNNPNDARSRGGKNRGNLHPHNGNSSLTQTCVSQRGSRGVARRLTHFQVTKPLPRLKSKWDWYFYSSLIIRGVKM